MQENYFKLAPDLSLQLTENDAVEMLVSHTRSSNKS